MLVVLIGATVSVLRSNAAPVLAVKDRYSPTRIIAKVPSNTPIRIESLYDRPEWISDADLVAVLKQVRPRMGTGEFKPNHVEHALRTWGAKINFGDPEILSGPDMVSYLTDAIVFQKKWGKLWTDNKVRPLLADRPAGISVNYGTIQGESVHHDHALACLTEAGVALDTPVYGPRRRLGITLNDMLQEALRDFRLDEKETEWTALAFGLWISPETHEWVGSDGRTYSFDLIAQRLMRGLPELGVCHGTHRIYSLMVLIRLDDNYGDVLSDPIRAEAMAYLERVRDAISQSQFPDGHWPSNWPEGAKALTNLKPDEMKEKIIATGHHLEWLAIAPRELHPPDELIQKAMRWSIDTTIAQTPEEIRARYTFLSHIGNALALWRGSHPAEFLQSHPDSAVGDIDVLPAPESP